MHEYLRTICGDVRVARGEYDEAGARYAETELLTVSGVTIGLCHGHQVVPWGDVDALAMLQRQLDVDVLGRLMINPGSATGAYSSLGGGTVNPSFVLMDIDGHRVVVYVYELLGGEVKVDKIDFKKPQPVEA
eukprot:SM000812S22579  [mRNA]  locus=s812:1594:2224:- [translate_table: standard]